MLVLKSRIDIEIVLEKAPAYYVLDAGIGVKLLSPKILMSSNSKRANNSLFRRQAGRKNAGGRKLVS